MGQISCNEEQIAAMGKRPPADRLRKSRAGGSVSALTMHIQQERLA
jgi:hypothetical protein